MQIVWINPARVDVPDDKINQRLTYDQRRWQAGYNGWYYREYCCKSCKKTFRWDPDTCAARFVLPKDLKKIRYNTQDEYEYLCPDCTDKLDLQ